MSALIHRRRHGGMLELTDGRCVDGKSYIEAQTYDEGVLPPYKNINSTKQFRFWSLNRILHCDDKTNLKAEMLIEKNRVGKNDIDIAHR